MSAGEVAYFGECQQIGPYLGDVGITIPDDHNPADFVVDLTYARDDENVVEKLVNSWRTSERGAKMAKLVKPRFADRFQARGRSIAAWRMFMRRVDGKSDGNKAAAAGTPQSVLRLCTAVALADLLVDAPVVHKHRPRTGRHTPNHGLSIVQLPLLWPSMWVRGWNGIVLRPKASPLMMRSSSGSPISSHRNAHSTFKSWRRPS